MIGWIIVLTVFGLLLVFSEIYVPGGILGTLGAVCLIAAVAVAYFHSITLGNITLVAVLLITVGGIAAGLHFFPKTPAGKRLTLNTRLGAENDHPSFDNLVGQEGVALTALRPSGKALIGNKRIDVLAQGPLIDKDEAIVVAHSEGAKVVVRRKNWAGSESSDFAPPQ